MSELDAGFYLPASPRVMAEVRRLAERWGKPPPRDDLTAGEAADALKALRNFKAMEAKAMPADDPEMQPGETLRHWFPFRRTGDSRGYGERLA